MSDKRKAQEKIIDEVVAETLEAFGPLLAKQDRDFAKQLLGDILATHPVTTELLDVIVEPDARDHSDEVPKDGLLDDENAVVVGGEGHE